MEEVTGRREKRKGSRGEEGGVQNKEVSARRRTAKAGGQDERGEHYEMENYASWGRRMLP
jgi:hypothetical protein